MNVLAQDSVSISDFRYPETRAIDWKGGLMGSFSTNDYESNQYARTRGNSLGNINLNSQFSFFHSHDDHDNSIRLSGSLYYVKSEELYPSDSEERRTEMKRGNVDLDWAYRHYLTAEGFHVSGIFRAHYDVSYTKTNSITRTSTNEQLFNT
ncbi:MAG TPA: hypothetical protein VGR15_04555, partial [Bacteroidota bacterium]|nr:hypothetical protein [Bacteroidota bacterium]